MLINALLSVKLRKAKKSLTLFSEFYIIKITKMFFFKTGDKIMYPNQGLAVIEDTQIEKYFGEEFHIYHVRIISNNALVLVPSSNADEIGIRKPIDLETIKKIFKFMRKGSIEVSMNWKGRYKEHVDLMKTGAVIDVAHVLKSLFYLNLIKPLSFREKKMMEKAKELIICELSEVSSQPPGEIEKQLMNDLSCCFKDVVARDV